MNHAFPGKHSPGPAAGVSPLSGGEKTAPATVPRLLIAAPHGRSGKTTATITLLAALRSAGLIVQAYKKGPDFIDPSWLTLLTGRPCRNLDPFLMDEQHIVASVKQHTAGADLAVIEGAMGLYDGVDLEGSGSTAVIAKTVQSPVLLVVDTTRMTRSVAALVMGYQHFDREVHIAGVILNKVARPRHEQMLVAAVEHYCGVPVVGIIPKDQGLSIPDRHLGLIPAGEVDELVGRILAAGEQARQYFHLEVILQIARQAPPLPDESLAGSAEAPAPPVDGPGLEAVAHSPGWPGMGEDGGKWVYTGTGAAEPRRCLAAKAEGSGPRIGIIRDRAFSFYYPENLEALQSAGAELVFIDALSAAALPPVHGLYIGGGFPEVFARELSANQSLLQDIKSRVETGLPVYAECGGLMFLSRSIISGETAYPLTGIFPCDVVMCARPQGHGYEEVQVLGNNPYYAPGTVLRGHEFHHSRLVNVEEGQARFAFRVTRGRGIDGVHDGLVYKNVLACYLHLHALTVPGWAPALVDRARWYKEKCD
ncbi:MAG: cobyrinate a,c-diamide synthase [Desulfurispora sp.]|uniref:cobyrinate a,c-diamide synthase n=1 Tax=Desulfurispora sp. TaxID=3014275 RepID=UPI00404A4E5E